MLLVENNTNCTVGLWSEWSKCSSSCDLGSRYRTRKVEPKVCENMVTIANMRYCEEQKCPPEVILNFPVIMKNFNQALQIVYFQQYNQHGGYIFWRKYVHMTNELSCLSCTECKYLHKKLINLSPHLLVLVAPPSAPPVPAFLILTGAKLRVLE